jgi:hypothetical protein
MIKRHWFVIVGGVYGLLMAAVGAPITTLPFWVGMGAVVAVYVGAKAERP